MNMSTLKTVFSLFMIPLVFSSCETLTDTMMPHANISDPEPLIVMTYNVYVGAHMGPVLLATGQEVPIEVANTYNQIIASDFPSRARGIAKSIKAYHPHIIGFQEITLLRRQTSGDRVNGGNVPAEEVVLDFLQLLMEALRAEGLVYHIAAQVQDSDAELAMHSGDTYDDVRLTDFDVILARNDVVVSRVTTANFNARFPFIHLGFELTRGYVAIDATVSGVTYRVVNTHLEAFPEGIRIKQTKELVVMLNDETLPMILMGDFNANPESIPYQHLLSAGYVDVWPIGGEGRGTTCCQDDIFHSEVNDRSTRIDHIFVRNMEVPAAVVAHTVGDTPADRLPSGLWPSDHAGVVAKLPRLSPPDL